MGLALSLALPRLPAAEAGPAEAGRPWVSRAVSGLKELRATVRTPTQQRMAARLQLGQPVRVRLRSVDAKRGTVDVELIDEL